MSSNDTTRNALSPDPGNIQATALTWVKRRTAGLTPGEREQFRAWLTAEERHAKAFAQADKGADEFDWPLHSDTVDEVLAGLEKRAQKRHRRRVASIAATAAVLAVTGTFWMLQHRVISAAPLKTLASPSGLLVVQPQQRILPDGSVVELKDDAVLTVFFTPAFRRVELKQGTAHFKVAKNPNRPFVVTANGIEARAVGTAFSVQWGKNAVEVIVTEGRVAVDKPAPTESETTSAIAAPSAKVGHLAEVDAGHRVVIGLAPQSAGAEVQAVTAAELNDDLSWRIPRLEFSGTPLSKVVAIMNEHATNYPNTHRLVLDPDLKNLRISGVLHADKEGALVTMLESDFGVKAERRNDGTIVLHRGR